MSSDDKVKGPKTFGEKFKEKGLVGALRKENRDKANPNEMHFLEHLEELRWVILKSILAFLLGCIGVAVFMQDSIKLLQMPLVSAVEDFGEIDIDLQSIGLEEYTKPLQKQEVDLRMLRDAREEDLQAWGITDPHHQTRILSHFSVGKNRNLLQVIRSFSPIFIAMKICFLGGLGLSLPLIFYFVGSFVVPGLTPQEKRIFFPGCLAATLLFLAGAAMAYFFILPLSLAFTIEFSFNVLGLDVYRPEAGNYYSLVIWLTFAVGVAFEFPLILILLIKIGMLSVAKLRESRRLVLVIIMIAAAIITPGGDPISLLTLTVPLYVLYELSIIVGAVIEKSKARREWEEWDEEIQGPRPPKPSRGKSSWMLYLVILTILVAATGLVMQNRKEVQNVLNQISAFFGDEKTDRPPPPLERNSSLEAPTDRSDNDSWPADSSFILKLIPMDQNDSGIDDLNSSGGTFRARVLER